MIITEANLWMHMNLLQVQIKSLSAKPSLVHLGIGYSSQSPAGSELPRLLMSAETPCAKQSLCFDVSKWGRTRSLRQQMLHSITRLACMAWIQQPCSRAHACVSIIISSLSTLCIMVWIVITSEDVCECVWEISFLKNKEIKEKHKLAHDPHVHDKTQQEKPVQRD